MAKVILITGASSGIGKETALLLAKQGNKVYGAARRIDMMKILIEAGVIPIEMDVTDDASMTNGVNRIITNEGRIDVLINNAGYGSYGALEDVPLTEARYQFEVNIFGMARLIQLILPYMRREHAGKIINISSIGGRIGEPHGSWYHATKFAVEGLSDSLRMELKEFGIDVIVIRPGAIFTEWNRISRDNLAKVSGKSAYKDLANRHVKMLARADDRGSHPSVVAQTIAYAVAAKKPKTRYATGKNAHLVLFLKAVLSDRMFDYVMLSQMK